MNLSCNWHYGTDLPSAACCSQQQMLGRMTRAVLVLCVLCRKEALWYVASAVYVQGGRAGSGMH